MYRAKTEHALESGKEALQGVRPGGGASAKQCKTDKDESMPPDLEKL